MVFTEIYCVSSSHIMFQFLPVCPSVFHWSVLHCRMFLWVTHPVCLSTNRLLSHLMSDLGVFGFQCLFLSRVFGLNLCQLPQGPEFCKSVFLLLGLHVFVSLCFFAAFSLVPCSTAPCLHAPCSLVPMTPCATFVQYFYFVAVLAFWFSSQFFWVHWDLLCWCSCFLLPCFCYWYHLWELKKKLEKGCWSLLQDFNVTET